MTVFCIHNTNYSVKYLEAWEGNLYTVHSNTILLRDRSRCCGVVHHNTTVEDCPVLFTQYGINFDSFSQDVDELKIHGVVLGWLNWDRKLRCRMRPNYSLLLIRQMKICPVLSNIPGFYYINYMHIIPGSDWYCPLSLPHFLRQSILVEKKILGICK